MPNSISTKVNRCTTWLLAGLLTCLSTAVPAAIQLSNADGSTLELDNTAQSLVTLSPHLAELVFAAGAGDRLAATVEFSEYPAQAIHVPRIGDAFRLDIERIVAHHPDLVIAWDSGNPRAAVEQLRRLGLSVWSVEIREPADIGNTLLALGEVTGNTEETRAIAAQLEQRLAHLARQYGNAVPVSYFYQVDERPLFTINGEHLISKGLALCGGLNVFADQSGLAFQVAHEAVVTANPDVMFAAAIDNAQDPLAAWRQWPSLDAVTSGSLFLLPADKISRATPRWLDSLELACTLLHGSRRQETNDKPPD